MLHGFGWVARKAPWRARRRKAKSPRAKLSTIKLCMHTLYHNLSIYSILSIYSFYFYLFYGLCLVAKILAYTMLVVWSSSFVFFPTHWCTCGRCTGTRFLGKKFLLVPVLWLVGVTCSWCYSVVERQSTRDRHDGETCGRQGQASGYDTNQSHCHDQRRTCRSSWELTKQR